MKWTKREQDLIRQLTKIKLSPTHSLDHATNVCQHGLALLRIHGGRRNIVIAAALLHDLGRSKPKLHGAFSVRESLRLAKPLLRKAGYTSGEIKLICQAIAEHDQPNFSSKLLESKILKDADFLDGFGARGILRAAYYTGEAGEPFKKVIKRLKVKMRQRFEGLEFEESKKMAEEQVLLVQLVMSYFQKTDWQEKLYQGKYIVFEGISGTGKETQAKLLKKYLEKKGKKVEIIYHPHPRLKERLKNWRKEKISLMTEAFLFTADRHDMAERKLLPALKKGKWVISLRSRITCMAYQGENEWEEDLIDYLFSTFEPKPDLIFYFDLKPKEALKRINKRTAQTGEEKGVFEKIRLLTEKRKRYKKVLVKFHEVFTIDASGTVEEIQEKIQKRVESLWQTKLLKKAN